MDRLFKINFQFLQVHIEFGMHLLWGPERGLDIFLHILAPFSTLHKFSCKLVINLVEASCEFDAWINQGTHKDQSVAGQTKLHYFLH